MRLVSPTLASPPQATTAALQAIFVWSRVVQIHMYVAVDMSFARRNWVLTSDSVVNEWTVVRVEQKDNLNRFHRFSPNSEQ